MPVPEQSFFLIPGTFQLYWTTTNSHCHYKHKTFTQNFPQIKFVVFTSFGAKSLAQMLNIPLVREVEQHLRRLWHETNYHDVSKCHIWQMILGSEMLKCTYRISQFGTENFIFRYLIGSVHATNISKFQLEFDDERKLLAERCSSHLPWLRWIILPPGFNVVQYKPSHVHRQIHKYLFI